jgi:hypothetical protein
MTAGFASIAGGVMAASRQTFSSLCKYGGFLKWGLPKIINFSIGFSIINHPFRGTAILRNFHMHTESTIWGCVWKRDILQLEFPLVRYGPMMSDQVKFRSHLGNPIPALELLQHLPWRWKTNSWLPMLKTRSAVQEAGDGHPGPWGLDFWGATCCFLESGNAGWSWKFANHQRSYG